MTAGKTQTHSSHFEVDRAGLAKLLAKKGKFFALAELIQNAWDTNATKVDIKLNKLAKKPYAHLIVTDDDPEGFHDLAHAYTLFAESVKKGDPTLRGRFNLGEKLVLALCRWATVASTTGTIRFNEDGTRQHTPIRTGKGSVFEAEIRMTREEFDEVCQKIDTLIPPGGVETLFNGEPLRRPEKAGAFECILPTIKADDEGNLTRTRRKTRVDVYRVAQTETAWIYELGLPVVEHDGAFHIDVQQKVPVSLDRDNVPPAYLRKLRTETLNQTYKLLEEDDAAETWVSDALGHADVSDEAVEAALAKKYGEKRFKWDPKDLEANNRLVAMGYKPVGGGAFGKEQWKNIKRAGALRRAGEISPTPKATEAADHVPQTKWTAGMREVVDLAVDLALDLLEVKLTVHVIYGRGFEATYGKTSSDSGVMTFYFEALGRRWFDTWRDNDENIARTVDLINHELAHHKAENHLSEEYYHALSELSAKAFVLALRNAPKYLRHTNPTTKETR